MSPLISVIIPVYNAERYLRQSLESVLGQTYENFELLLIDDGSTDESFDIMKSYEDRRIRILRNPGNQGIVYSLNRGLEEARGDFFARMDADDICFPERFAKQISFLQKYPDVDVCGAWLLAFSDEKEWLIKYPETDLEIKAKMIFGNVLAHPAVMLRAKTLKERNLFYDAEYLHAEDYALWCRMMFEGRRFYNIQVPLLHYRVGHASVSNVHHIEQLATTKRIQTHMWERLYGGAIPDIPNWSDEHTYEEFRRGVAILDEVILRECQKKDANKWLLDELKNYRLRYIRKHRYLGGRVLNFVTPGDVAFKFRYAVEKRLKKVLS